MHDYIFSRFLSTDTETADDHPDILFGGKDSILPPKREEEKKKYMVGVSHEAKK